MIQIYGHEIATNVPPPWPATEIAAQRVAIPTAWWDVADAAMRACVECSGSEIDNMAARAQASPEVFPNTRLGWPSLETPGSRVLFDVYWRTLWSETLGARNDLAKEIYFRGESATRVARGVACGLSILWLREPDVAPLPYSQLDLHIEPLQPTAS